MQKRLEIVSDQEKYINYSQVPKVAHYTEADLEGRDESVQNCLETISPQDKYNHFLQTSEEEYDKEEIDNKDLQGSINCVKNENLPSEENIFPGSDRENNREYLCPYCNYTNCDIYQVQKHISDHKEYVPWKCFMCGKVCANKRSLKVHLFLHTGEKPFSCTECDFKFAAKAALDSHARTHTNDKSFMCDICGYKTIHKGYINVHKRIVHEGVKSFSCSQCDKTFSQSHHLREHVAAVHLGERPYSCSECDYTCRAKNDLKRHMDKHTGLKNCICPICGFRAVNKKYIANHVKRLHSLEKETVLCTECGVNVGKNALKRHMLIHTGEKPFACPKCTYKCRQSGTLKTHMMTHMGDVNVSSITLPYNVNMAYSCDVCNHECTTETELETHKLIHKDHVSMAYELNNTTQSEDKPHKCTYCDYACRQKQSLRRHVILKHLNEKPS